MNQVATQVIKFSITDAAIAELREKYADPKVPESPSEYDALKADLKDVATVRIAIDKERKEQTRKAIDHQKAVNTEGNRIIDELKGIEEPMKVAKAVVDDAEERKVREAEEVEEARLNKIQTLLELIQETGTVPFNTTLEYVKKQIAALELLDPAEGFDEFAKKAAEFKKIALDGLNDACQKLTAEAADAERRKAEQEELDRRRAELDEAEAKQKAEQKRLDDEQAAKEAEERRKEQARLDELEAEKRETEARIEADKEKARQKALAPDKEKLMVFSQELREIEYPQCTYQTAKNIVLHASRRIVAFAEGIEKDAEQL